MKTIKELQCSPYTVEQQQRVNTTHEKQKKITELESYRLFLSSAGKQNSYKFTEHICERMTNIQKIRFINTSLRYTEPTTSAELHDNIFIVLKNFPNSNYNVSARSTSNFDYHCSIPLNVYSSSGTIVKINKTFPYDYSIQIGRRVNIKDIIIEVYYQDNITGEFHLFNDLNYINLEIELY